MRFFFAPAIAILYLSVIASQKAGRLNPPVPARGDSLVPTPAQSNGVIDHSRAKIFFDARQALAPGIGVGEWNFASAKYGDIPSEWTDLLYRQPSRNWLVDAEGYLRHVLKNRNNRLTYEPFSNSFLESPTPPTRPGLIALAANNLPANIRVKTRFKKTPDAEVFFGVAGRIKDKDNFYTAILSGSEKLIIAKVKNGEMVTLTDIVLLRRYQYPDVWEMAVVFQDDLITGILYDSQGNMIARADARDGELTAGTCGLYSTDYAAAASFSVAVTAGRSTGTPVIEYQRPQKSTVYNSYSLIKPVTDPASVPTSFEQTDTQYDIVVAGGGTAGWAAAVQAARMGRSVLLLEETDWIGGQMCAAAVTSMDESGPLIRERGIYREFHESMVAYYYGKDKCPFMAYFWGRNSQNQQEGGYEPRIARNVLYGFIEDARVRGKKNGSQARLDLLLRTKVTGLSRNANTITGVAIQQWNENDRVEEKKIRCKLLVDATEYGDVIPLTGAPYRVGNTKSEAKNLKGAVQDHTFTAVIREYPDGVPEHLRMTAKPPRYAEYSKAFNNRSLAGDWVLHRGARMYRAELAWRGMADSESPLFGKISQYRHTLTGINGGNDYPVSVATIEDPQQRLTDEREGIYRTLAKIYYLQNELGVSWSVAEDQGYNTAYNRAMMKRRGIPDSFLNIVNNMPQLPYVRESRRMEGMVMIVAKDMDRWEKAKHVPTSVAVGDYFMDLHGTKDAFETDLDAKDFAHMGGPFQVPFEAFIPKDLDGFLPAEKNFSQSRLVNGATRLQPITMLTGQAVGVIAALAVEKGVQPRKLNPISVQYKLLEYGATLIPRWYKDVAWGTETWKALQLLSLYKIMDKPGELEYWDGMEFASKSNWGTQAILTVGEATEALTKLARVLGYKVNMVTPKAAAGELPFSQLQKLASGINGSFGSLIKSCSRQNVPSFTHETFALLCLDVIKKRI